MKQYFRRSSADKCGDLCHHLTINPFPRGDNSLTLNGITTLIRAGEPVM